MKRTVLFGGWLFLCVFISGCFETNFNFKTIVHGNGAIDRDVKIEGRGANRFLPPEGPQWQVKTFETKGGQTILQDTHYHIYATGRFKNSAEMGSDFRYNVAELVKNVTDETRKEFVEELGIQEPFDQDIHATNQVQLKRKRSFWTVEYDYTETFQNRWLIPILVHDLKKEIMRKEAVPVASVGAEAPAPVPGETNTPTPVLAPALLAPEKVEAMAQAKLKDEILPQFRFHSELTLPGKINSSNASVVRGRTLVWDFTGVDFEKNYSAFELHATSRAVNVGVILALVVLGTVVVLVLATLPKPKLAKKR